MAKTTTIGEDPNQAMPQGQPLAADRIVSEDDAGSAAMADEAAAERGEGSLVAANPSPEAAPAGAHPSAGDAAEADTTPDEDPSAQRQGHVEAGMRS
ncbi:hypothetical protein [Aureimonas pseudogalii]|uniref:Uncharacterized protein n=1 Tax=Aureimonas pseudogalii TaxID=1744844 RepID=A0A7W6H5J3_9HYPH|nr:hypothetical protein [Aureimonas pseudogalii]MBB3998960.1 hypothetical protein [Aureimonas pseudogalii]